MIDFQFSGFRLDGIEVSRACPHTNLCLAARAGILIHLDMTVFVMLYRAQRQFFFYFHNYDPSLINRKISLMPCHPRILNRNFLKASRQDMDWPVEFTRKISWANWTIRWG